ncbi:hypothetical protein M514_09611 [Trichuris suis]|uniref:G-protein coupled receptors family 1 profile domain-containing protein n=1 Tax=Trichuris suis TaxID=68888 RepID=A0A085N878_9BILA|nr:hypothetical protein M513_09611 [Trichuris suis]KFD65674.1 hypothetical protein M514_09611 [Trichuris suis]KHJ48495.1 hypothetical protein D918_00797 [Trichuris suis]
MESALNNRFHLRPIDDCGKPNMPIFILYILAHIIALCLNYLLAFLASKLKAKQACTILLIAFSLANLLMSATSVFSDFHKLYLLIHNDDEQAVTPLECLSRRPELFISLFSGNLSALLVLCMSLERMTWLSRLKMHTYLFTPQRTKLVCLVAGMISGAMLLFCFNDIAKSSTFLRPLQCSIHTIISPMLYRNMTYWNLSVSYFVGIIYLIAYFVYWYKKRRAHTQLQSLQVRRDEAYTRSLAIIMLLTIALHVFPRTLILLINENQEATISLGNRLALLKHIVWIFTPLIYFCSNPDIKEQFCKLLASNQWLKNRMRQQSSVVYIG